MAQVYFDSGRTTVIFATTDETPFPKTFRLKLNLAILANPF